MDDQGRYASGTLAGIQTNGPQYPVTVGAGLTLVDGTLSASGGAGGGAVTAPLALVAPADDTITLSTQRHSATATGNHFETRDELGNVQTQIDPGGVFSTTAYAGDVGFSSTGNRVRIGQLNNGVGAVFESQGQSPVGIYNRAGAFVVEINGDFRFQVNNDGTIPLKFPIFWEAGSSSGDMRETGRIASGYLDNTDATHTGYIALVGTDYAGQRIGVEAGSDGTQALVGFFGVTPVARPSLTYSRTGESAAAAALRGALAALGLIADNTTA